MIDWVWNYGIPIFLTCCASAGLLAFALVLLSDTITNPIQYLRNYLNARRMKREREDYHRKLKAKFGHIELSDEDRQYVSGRQVSKEDITALYSRLYEQILRAMEFRNRRLMDFLPGGISTPMTRENGEYAIPMSARFSFSITCHPDSSIAVESLQAQLQAAIDREDYEEAARLRDEIKKKGA